MEHPPANRLIEDIRRALSEGITSGKVVVAGSSKEDIREKDRIQHHPTFEILEAAAIADVAVIDDRYFNQHSNVQNASGSVPLWTTYDLLSDSGYDYCNGGNTSRRCGARALALFPTTVEELSAYVAHAPISEAYS
jgi:hypothetical protein